MVHPLSPWMKKTLNLYWEDFKMKTKKWKKKIFYQIERQENWSNKKKCQCVACNNENLPCIEIKNGQLCVKCIVDLLKEKVLIDVYIQDWTLNDFAEYLKKGSVIERLLVLWRIEDVLLIVGQREGEKVFQLYQSLLRNLGYTGKHPLSAYVRQAAHETAVFIGKSILPVLICTSDSVPAIHYANAVLTAATISPDNVEVQRMLKKAAYHENKDIKRILLNACEHINDPWAIQMIQIMRNDLNPSIKDTAERLYSIKGIPKLEKRKIHSIRIPADFLNHLQSNYNLDFLKMIYDEYLHLFFDIQYFGMTNHLIRSKLKKHDLIHAFATLLCDEDNFWSFMDAVHEDVYGVLERLVWEGGELHARKLDQTLSEKVCLIEKMTYKGQTLQKNQLNPKYCIFKVRKVHSMSQITGWVHNYYLSLPSFLCTHLKQYLPKPEFYNLVGLKEIPKQYQIFSEKDSILFQLPLIWAYVEEDNVKFASSSGKPVKSALNKMIKDCSLVEFYPSGTYEDKHIRANLLACFLKGLSYQQFKNIPETEKMLKEMMDIYFENSDTNLLDYFKLIYFLSHLKGWRKVYSSYHYRLHFQKELELRNEIKAILKELTVGDWISIDNIINYCFYRNIPVDIVDRMIACHYFHFQYTTNVSGEWEASGGKTYVSETNYAEVITKPAIRMLMFFFASLGIIDIAYTKPENDTIRSVKRPYFSEYDGLEYIRLSELGAYVLGKTSTFDYRSKLNAEITLDDQRLIANIKGFDPAKQMVLEKMGEMIHDGCYRMNYQTFLKGCRSTKDIDFKIELFDQHISDNPPDNWKNFIHDITAKKNPLIKKGNMCVFKLKDNQELIDLIAQDELLRKVILIAEDYHIIVLDYNVIMVQRRLEEFGFFVDL